MLKLFKHQEAARDFILSNENKARGTGAIFHEMGLGKTRTALEIYMELRKEDLSLTMLVICPLSLIEAAWGEDIKKFTDLTYANLRKKQTIPTPNIVLINYESFMTKKGMMLALSYGCKMIVLDESSRMKNHSSQTTKGMIKLIEHFKYRIVMSGTPAPNCELEYWAQILFIGGNLHPSFFAFRNTYFHLERGNQTMRGRFMPKAQMQQIFRSGWKYAITSKKREQLMDSLKPFVHQAKKDECLDLPERTDEIRLVELGPKQKAAYNEMKRHLIIEIEGKEITASVALTKIMKLREITSGFALDEHGLARNLPENVKLKELRSILDEASNQPIIIWCQFRHEIETIKEWIGNFNAFDLYGATHDRELSINGFKNGVRPYLIAHPKSAAHGLTFVNCSLQIFYSMDYSWESYEQAKARIHRAGQTKACTYVHILAKGTIDEDIYNVLKRKGDVQDILYALRKK